MRSTVDQLARAGARPLLLAGFEGRIPTEAEAQNLAVGREFGPGGSFWAGRSDGAWRYSRSSSATRPRMATSTATRGPTGPTRAERTVRHRFVQARAAIAMTGRDVGLLAQADDGGSGSSTWVDHMFRAVPNLGRSSTGGRSTRTGRARGGSRR